MWVLWTNQSTHSITILHFLLRANARSLFQLYDRSLHCIAHLSSTKRKRQMVSVKSLLGFALALFSSTV